MLLSRLLMLGVWGCRESPIPSFALSLSRSPLRLAEPFSSSSPRRSESYDELDWLLSSPIVSSLDGPIAGRATQYLKIMLERHDGPETFYRYRAAVLEKLLESDRRLPLPTWLIEFFAVSVFSLVLCVREGWKTGMRKREEREKVRCEGSEN